jgi:hypothetical protein
MGRKPRPRRPLSWFEEGLINMKLSLEHLLAQQNTLQNRIAELKNDIERREQAIATAKRRNEDELPLGDY